MSTLRTKGSWSDFLKRFKRTFVNYSSGPVVYGDNRGDERLKKMLQQREEFIKWANTF